ncbi:MAG: tetratricopeptide repeat protein [Planctomycetes bacterium]|nr:tetratricopeptide repeat protein [Planctomycetota bacterium]
MTEERRTVVVLFAQALGLADLPETDRAATAVALFARLRAVVERHGGAVDKFTGDVLMALWGAPVAHEDDPVRAVRAALALRRETGALGAERGHRLELRAGINAGEVIWGSVGGAAPTAMGDVVNVAQRLEDAAEPGTILAARPVALAAGPRLRLRQLSPIRVRGRQDPVEPWLVEGEGSPQTEFRRAAEIATPIVGRERELERLLASFARGRGGYFVLEGEAGIGKSRLLHELRRRLRAERPGTWIGVGRAREGPPLPLGAFAEIIRGEVGEADGARVAARLAEEMAGAGALEAENRGHLIAMSLGFAVARARVTGIEPSRVLSEMRYAWECWLRSRAARAPAVLCVEDLHWADGGTVALMEHFAARLPGVPVFVVGSARPGARLPSGHERLSLGELPGDALARLAVGVLPGPLSGELLEFLVQQSGGNPYYLEELARFLMEEKLLTGSPSRLAARPDRIPAGLQGLLVARLDGVGAATRDALKAAAVVGRTFWNGLLSRLLGQPAEPFIAEAHARQMVFPRDGSLLPGDAEHVFKHALLRDAAYSLLPRKERARLHRRVAELLPADGSRKVKILAAGHREAAAEPAEAARLWLEAGEEAMEACAWDEAESGAAQAERLGAGPAAALLAACAAYAGARFDAAGAAAARAAAASDPAVRAQALLCSARVLERHGETARSLELANEVIEVSVDPLVRADALVLRASAFEALGRLEEAASACREGIALAGSGEPRALRILAALEEASSRAQFRLGRAAEARDAADRAIRAANAAGDRRAIARSLSQKGGIEFAAGAWDAALDANRRALAIRRETGDRSGTATSLQGLGNVHYRRGDWDEALRSYDESLRISLEVGDLNAVAASRSNAANVYFQRGDYPAALAGYEESIRLRRESGHRGSLSIVLCNKGNVHGSRGEYDEARAAFEEALGIAREIGDRPTVGLVLVNLALLHYFRGRFEDSLGAAEEALSIRRSLGDQPGVAECLGAAGVARQALGDLAGAGAAHAEALEIRRGAGEMLGVAESLASLGALRFLRGDFEAARRDFEETVALCRGLGQKRVLAQALCSLSLLLQQREDPAAALPPALESLALRREISDRKGTLESLLRLGGVHAAAGRAAEARPCFEEAAELARALGSSADEAAAAEALAGLAGADPGLPRPGPAPNG